MPHSDSVEYAAGLEADADEYAEERGELLLEAVSAWRRAGQPERARRIADALIAEGGDDACFARVERVELSLDDDDWSSARADLAELAGQPALDEHHCLFAAELLVERGALQEGLEWFDRAVARLDADDLERIGDDALGWSPMITLLRQRRELRERLGLPEDATDTLAETASRAADDFLDGLSERVRGPSFPRRLRVLVFRRAERAEVRRRWPEVYDATDELYYSTVELGWRELRDGDAGTTIQLVPGSAPELVAFAENVDGSPTDSEVKTRFARTVPDSATITWPPERNAPCWCGSDRKYKKCCGRPDPRPSTSR